MPQIFVLSRLTCWPSVDMYYKIHLLSKQSYGVRRYSDIPGLLIAMKVIRNRWVINSRCINGRRKEKDGLFRGLPIASDSTKPDLLSKSEAWPEWHLSLFSLESNHILRWQADCPGLPIDIKFPAAWNHDDTSRSSSNPPKLMELFDTQWDAIR